MNGLFNKIVKDKIIRYGNAISAMLIVIELLYTLLIYKSLPPFLPLFNQMPWGEIRLGDKDLLFLPIGLACGISLINFFFSTQLYDHMPLLSRMVTITSLLINVITFIFLFRMTRLVL
jgi:hypothetical protein